MTRSWQIVRVFISSTFRDMHAERDHLVKVVFPALRERLEKYHVHLVDIDLRWGVTKEQADNDQVLELCLQQIDECRPFFVGILGERYGWVPAAFPPGALARYNWVQRQTGKSVTELEIIHGMLANPRMYSHAFFYFRDPAALDAVPADLRRVVYAETDPALKAQLAALKERIRASGFPVLDSYPARWDARAYDPPTRTYGRLTGLETLGRHVAEQLFAAIKTELGLREVPAVESDPQLREREDHERFIESRLRVYIGRDGLHQQLLAHLASDAPPPVLLTGAPGAGKSAALARLYAEQAGLYTLALAHFVGAGPESTSLTYLLRRCCAALRETFPPPPGDEADGGLPDEPNELRREFSRLVRRVPPGRSALFVIDALDQLDEAASGRELDWLPATLPPGVKLVLSCTSDGDGEPIVQRARERALPVLEVGPLSEAERREIVRTVPLLSAKALDESQIALLLNNPATTNPLFLRVAFEELRGFGSFEQLNERIAAFPRVGDTVAAIFTQVIERLEAEFDSALVAALLSLLAAARRGLAERELQELVAALPGRDDLFPVLRQLRPYLLSRDGLHDFYHRQLDRAVRMRYLSGTVEQQAAHARLADYFEAQPDWLPAPDAAPQANERKADELPWQQAHAGRWAALGATLSRFDFLAAKNQAFGPHLLFKDLDLLDSADPRAAAQCDRASLLLLRDALKLAAHVLEVERGQLAEQLTGRLLAEPAPALQALLASAAEAKSGVWLRPLSATLASPRQPLLRTLFNGAASVHNMAAGAEADLLVVYTADGYTLLDLRSGEELRRVGTAAELTELREAAGAGAVVVGGQSMPRLGVSTNPEAIRCSARAPDGRRRFTGSIDGRIDVWDLASGRELGLFGHHGQFKGARPTHDRVLEQLTWNSMITVRQSGARAWEPFAAPDADAINDLALTPDGARLVSASNDRTLKVWDAESGAELLTLAGHAAEVYVVAVTPDGHRLASGAKDGTIKLWELDTGRELATLVGHAAAVNFLAFYARGARLVSADVGGAIKTWDVGRAVAGGRSQAGDGVPVGFVALAPDERRAYTFTHGATLRVWALPACVPLDSQPCPEGAGSPLSPTADRRRIISSPGSNDIQVWDVETGVTLLRARGWDDYSVYRGIAKEQTRVNEDRRWQITAAALTPDERQLVSANSWRSASVYREEEASPNRGDAGVIKLWDVPVGIRRETICRDAGYIAALALTPDGGTLFACTGGNVVKTKTGIKLPATGDELIRGWALATGKRRRAFRGRAPLVITPDGGWLVSATPSDDALQVTALRGSAAAPSLLVGHTGRVTSLACATGGTLLVSTGEDNTVRLWHLPERRLLATFIGDCAFTKCVVTADGLIVAGDAHRLTHFLRVTNCPALDPSAPAGHAARPAPTADGTASDRARFDAALALAATEGAETAAASLLDLAQAGETHPWVKFDAARELERLGRSDAALRVWAELTQEYECTAALRRYAAERLVAGASADEVAQTDLAVAIDAVQDEAARVRAVNALARAGRVEELLGVVRRTRDLSLTSYFRSPGLDLVIRAAQAAAALGGGDALLELAASPWLDSLSRVIAAEVAGHSGRQTPAASLLADLAREPGMHAAARLLAVQSKYNLDTGGDAICLLEGVVRDVEVETEYRERAVEAICQLGGIGALVFASPAYGAHAPLVLGVAGAGTDHKRRGLEQLEGAQYEKALANFDAALAAHGADAWVFCYRGEANLALGRHEQALQDFSQAVALDATQDHFFLRRAAAHQMLGDEQAALADCSRAHALNPKLEAALHIGALVWQVEHGSAAGRPASAAAPRAAGTDGYETGPAASGRATAAATTRLAVAAVRRLGFAEVFAEHLATLAGDPEVAAEVRRDARAGLEKLDRPDLLRLLA